MIQASPALVEGGIVKLWPNAASSKQRARTARSGARAFACVVVLLLGAHPSHKHYQYNTNNQQVVRAADAKEIVFDADSRRRLQAGINKVADAVCVTLGPRGALWFIICSWWCSTDCIAIARC
jgi:hypothetical protein